jgi:hypothetical protein
MHRTAILLFVTLRYFGIVPFRGAPTLLRLGDGAVSFSSGLVGSVGTTRCSYFLSLELPPVAHIASEGLPR